MIKFSCKNCGQKLNIENRHSGKRCKCPKCNNPVVVPAIKKRPPGDADTFSIVCSICGETIQIPKTTRGQAIECPSCSSNMETSSGGALGESHASIPPTEEDHYEEDDPEGYENSEGMDRRLIFIISGIAVVFVTRLIILAVVLRSSGKQPTERPVNLRSQQQVADADSRPQSVTSINTLSDSFTWTYINVDIELQENGNLLVSEQQKYSFKEGPNEKRIELSRLFLMDRIDDIQDIEVYEQTGSDETSFEPLNLTHRIERDQNDLRICWTCKPNESKIQTFLLKYRVIGSIYVGKNPRRQKYSNRAMDELYWNAVIWPRPAAVEKVKVTVHLPSKLRDKNRSIRSYGISAALNPDTDQDTVEYNSMNVIPPETGLQIYIAFQHNVLKIKKPDWQPRKSLRDRLPSRNIMIVCAIFFAISIVFDYHKRKCPLCGKIWGLKYAGERENLNAGKFYWFLGDYIYLYKCKNCDYKEWIRRGSGSGC